MAFTEQFGGETSKTCRHIVLMTPSVFRQILEHLALDTLNCVLVVIP